MPATRSQAVSRSTIARAGVVALSVLVAATAVLAGCRTTTHQTPHPAASRQSSPTPPTAPRGPLGGARPARLVAPEGAARGPALPLVLALHGYGDEGDNFAAALGLPQLARHERFLLVIPDGTPDRQGSRFWNATPACCNFDGRQVDDVTYLRGLVREVAQTYPVDRRRVYVIGLSNGGFMSHRLACEAADDFAAIVSIAGVPWNDPARCRPASPVSVLQVHGDSDAVVRYQGGRNLLGRGGPAYPSAPAAVDRWAALNGCRGPRRPAPPDLDLVRSLAGPATQRERVADCPVGVEVALYTIRGGPHVPPFNPAFASHVWSWLQAHPKPTPSTRRHP